MTISNIRKSRLFRITNVALIYALLLDVTVPFAQTMDQLLTKPVNYSINLNRIPTGLKTTEEILTKISQEIIQPATDEDYSTENQAINQSLKVAAAMTSPGAGGSGFSINSTDQMVDPFTGDFSYSIPLMDVEGYPITLSYNSNVTMNTEASWVGLGWNLNVGSIEREMRGIPDEFDGNQAVERVVNQLDQMTTGFKAGKYLGINVGGPVNDYISVRLGYNTSKLKGQYWDSYLGMGRTFDKSNGGNIGVTFNISYVGISLDGSLNKTFSYDSKRGIDLGFGGGLSGGISVLGIGGSVSTYSNRNYSSREGMTAKTITRGWAMDVLGVAGASHTTTSIIPYGSQTQVPRIEINSTARGSNLTKDRYISLSPFTMGKLSQSYNYLRKEVKNGNTIVQPAIGFLHSSKKMTASGSTLPIMDFNRSEATRYSEEMTTLPFSMQTFDIFYANAMGMQGTFRPYRSDVGTYKDPEAEDKTIDVTTLDKKGFEQDPALLGIQGTYTKEQGNGITINSTQSITLQKMADPTLIEFTPEVNPITGFDNAIYFRGVGETTPVDASLYNNLGGLPASQAYIWANNDQLYLSPTVSNSGAGHTFPTDGKVYLSKPTTATFFRPRTVSELMASPVPYDHYYNDHNLGPNPNATQVFRQAGKASNIISKIEITNDDGVFYGYGIPNFSNSSSQVVFNIGSNSGAPSVSVDAQGLVSYSPTDNSVLNAKGLANYYDRTTIPAYASSFLLTDIYSPDYVDRTGDGPTLDDIGNYYKFNYHKLHENYHWRFPIAPQKAFYIEGTWGSELDDLATYSAGSRQVWVSHSVESKNYIAEFILDLENPRKDGYGINENGNQISSEATYALKRIELYNRADRQTNGTNAKKLLVVEFNYDYELCQNYPGNSSTVPGQNGKLTLQEVHLYAGSSGELKHSYYQFDYGSGSVDNPDFNYGSIDAWGQLKPGNAIHNSRFPYVEQSQTNADKNAQAWKLKHVMNPGGGSIDITYESDRYAYVQNKRAMKHIKMEGLTNIFDLFTMLHENALDASKIRQELNTAASQISAYAVTSSLILTKYQAIYGMFFRHAIPNNVVVFKLDTPIPANSANAHEKVKQDYFTDNGNVRKELYLKAHIRVTDDDPSRTELVPVITPISEDLTDALNNIYPWDEAPAIGVLPPIPGNSNHTYGYVILAPFKVRNPADEKLKEGNDLLNDNILADEAFNPIQKAAFDLFQRSLQDIVFQNTAFQDGNSSVDLLSGQRMDISKAMRRLGFGTTLVNDYSSLCVYVPNNVKFGGNARVKSIEISDNWSEISGLTESTTAYKWNYLYDFQGYTSGVASYESRIARDESPFYGWDTYWNIRVRFPDKFNYTTKPAMELLYPSGSVGYSKVAVQFDNLQDRGYHISEFYTAKDRPVKESITPMHRETVDKVWKNAGEVRQLYGLTQGFSIETNDFHGKIKAQSIAKGSIGVDNNPYNVISKTTYEYYEPGEKQKLSDESGTITLSELGMEYDIHADARIIINKAYSSYAGSKKSWLLPFMAPQGIRNTTDQSSSNRGFYSHVLVKHANRSAVLKGIKSFYMGAENRAQNLVFDSKSGNVILSSLTDEFNDPIYSLNYPAHWHYPELRNISIGQGASFPLTLSSNTTITNPLMLAFLTPGDKLKFPNGTYAWVTKSYPWPSATTYFLIDENGNEFDISPGTYQVTIAASGRSNQVTAIMQHVETKTNPLAVSQINFPTTNILSASAITLRDKLNALCGEKTIGPINNNNQVKPGVINPYLYGLRGDLVPDNQWNWQSERVQHTIAGVRTDGAYTSYRPYYAKGTSGKWYPISNNNHPDYVPPSDPSLNILNRWRKSGETTLFNQYGNAIETKDPLKINSAQLLGYNQKLQLLPVASAVNAHKQDIAFDGFEDYLYYLAFKMEEYEPHFRFVGESPDFIKFTDAHRHSGLYSTVLSAGKKITATNIIKPFQEAKTIHADVPNNTGQVQDCDCIRGFSPTPGDYVISAWVKQPNNTAGSIQVIIQDNSSTPVQLLNSSFTTTAASLDGWQRIEGTLTIPANAGEIAISLKNNATENVYFDDFRIHPLLAGMETAVYNPVTLMKIASHDGYNFTTFYNYDENNQLVRVRVETNEGIKTVSESEMSIYKQP